MKDIIGKNYLIPNRKQKIDKILVCYARCLSSRESETRRIFAYVKKERNTITYIPCGSSWTFDFYIENW